MNSFRKKEQAITCESIGPQSSRTGPGFLLARVKFWFSDIWIPSMSFGTIKKMPFHVSRGRAFGPGIFDMKGGLVIALFAAEALAHAGWLPRRRIVFLWTSDEETGSKSSREVIEREARRSLAVLVLEPANGPKGKLKTRRKAVGTAELIITGRAAHAGLDPGAGVNAVHELALQAARLTRLNNPRRGITVNPTIAQGGTRSNVIPAEARLTIDLRAETIADMRRIERKLKTLRPILPGARVAVQGGFSRPPLERRASAALFSQARELAHQLGFSVDECLAGGGSDGNFTAALGVPTLDGLGAVGEAAHSPAEQVIISALPARAALLAGLLATLIGSPGDQSVELAEVVGSGGIQIRVGQVQRGTHCILR